MCVSDTTRYAITLFCSKSKINILAFEYINYIYNFRSTLPIIAYAIYLAIFIPSYQMDYILKIDIFFIQPIGRISNLSFINMLRLSKFRYMVHTQCV